MKTTVTATASNGTVLEVGKKYYLENWTTRKWIEIIDISIEEREMWTIDDKGVKCSYETGNQYFPYEEPQPKPFEGYQEYFILTNEGSLTRGFLNDEQLKEMQEQNLTYIDKICTKQEAIELGLKID